MRPSSIVFLNDFCIRYIQSEIESLVTHGASECWGTYNSSTGTGGGAGYANSCIHSGTIAKENTYEKVSDIDTVWYNYTTASANTIAGTSNTNTAAESVCPKGWTLPSKVQIDTNRSTSAFNPVKGGNYSNGTLYYESTYGFWWGSEVSDGAVRYFLHYNGSSLYTNGRSRNDGFYIRCVSEEKTVTDLTYMQDMTPQIAPALSLCI